jgi:elongation factor P
MIGINQIKVGVTIDIDGTPYMVVSVDHVKPGKGSAFARTKLRNLKIETIIDKTFKSDDKLKEAFIDERKLQYSYHAGGFYHFLDASTYEDTPIEIEKLRHMEKFLKDNLEISALYYENELLTIRLPNFVVYRITETEPGIKGDTSKSGTKPATLESGAVIQVPLFVDVNTLVKVDTRTGTYIERAQE